MLEFSKEELIEMIKERDLKIVLVVDVVQKDFLKSPYKIVASTEEELEKDISLYDLTIECKTKMLLTDSEIKHISKKGVLPF